MAATTREQLAEKKCIPCEGGVPKITEAQAKEHLEALPGWKFSHNGERIRREWSVKEFMTGIKFFNDVADLAEREGHHPDLHLENYRKVAIEIWTHAIGGLSENDFILAAKIDQIPVETKK